MTDLHPEGIEQRDQRLSHELRLVETHFEQSHCRRLCPMYSDVRQVCMVLSDDIDLAECPHFYALLEQDVRAMQEDV